jgi:hypothetical protein
MSVELQQLIAERAAIVLRVISLDNIVAAGLLARKRPEIIERLQTEILALRARVPSLDQTINKSDA